MAGIQRLRVRAFAGAVTVGAGLLGVVTPAQAAAATCPSPLYDPGAVDSGSGFTVGYKYVNHFAAVPGTDEAYAVGGVSDDGSSSPSTPYIQHWDGSSWSTVSPPSVSGDTWAEAFAVDALSTGDVWIAGAGGDTFPSSTWSAWVGHWNGTSWSTPQLTAPAQSSQVTINDIEMVAADDVWAVGSRHDSVTGENTGVAYHYDGSWNLVSVPSVPGLRLLAVDSVSSSDVWAVGDAGGSSYTMHWDGSVNGWQTVASPDPAGTTGSINGVVALGASDVWAVGGESTNIKSLPTAWHWNGSSWSRQQLPPIGNGITLNDVVATTAGDLWADGGGFPADAESLLHFNGSTWTALPAPTVAGPDFLYPSAILATRDHIWTGGATSANGAWINPICGLGTSVSAASGADPAITTTDTVDADHPLQTSVDLPTTVNGDVTIRETYSKPVVADIDIPAAPSAADPTLLGFFLDSSRYTGSVRTGSLVLKDGTAVPACTAAGAVPDPCVASDDLDVNGHQLTVRTTTGGIWTVSQAPATASLSYTTALTMKPRVTFSDVVGNVGAYTQGTRNFFMSTGGVQVPADFDTCTGGGSPTDCAQYGVDSARYHPLSPLVPGQTYRIDVNPPGEVPITDGNNVPVVPTSATFRASRTEQESSVAATYAWPRVATSSAYGGSYVRSRLANTSATYHFGSTGVRWYTVTGPSMGKAIVRVDGVTKCTCDLYSSTTHYHASRHFGGLADGNHTIQIIPTGTKRTASSNTFVAVDGFMPDASSLDSTPALKLRWQTIAKSIASGGHLARFDIRGGSLSFKFKGTGIRWYTLRGPSEGRAKVYIDGVLKQTYDAYAKAESITYRSFATSNGVHTVKIVPTGTRSPASKATYVTVDRFYVL